MEIPGKLAVNVTVKPSQTGNYDRQGGNSDLFGD
jgi:hypothetical protein